MPARVVRFLDAQRDKFLEQATEASQKAEWAILLFRKKDENEVDAAAVWPHDGINTSEVVGALTLTQMAIAEAADEN